MIWLRILCLAVHLFLMNLASAGPLVAVWLDARATRRDSPQIAALGRRLGWISLAALGLGVLLGVAQGLLVWSTGDRAWFEALSALWDSKVVYGFWEIGFSVVCLVGYLIWWQRSKRASLWQRILSRLLAVVAATNLLYHFPTLFTIMGMVARGEVSVEAPIDSSEFRTLLVHPEVVSFTLHFWFASCAVSGQIAGMLCLQRIGEQEREATAKSAFAIALIPTLLQIPVGFVLTTSLNSPQQSRLMGGDVLSTGAFVVSLGLALWLMHLQAALVVGEPTRRKALVALATLGGTILLMTTTLLLSRADGLAV